MNTLRPRATGEVHLHVRMLSAEVVAARAHAKPIVHLTRVRWTTRSGAPIGCWHRRKSVPRWEDAHNGDEILKVWCWCPALQVRKTKRRASVTAEVRTKEREERLPLVDRQQLSGTRHPALRYEVVREQLNLAEKRLHQRSFRYE